MAVARSLASRSITGCASRSWKPKRAASSTGAFSGACTETETSSRHCTERPPVLVAHRVAAVVDRPARLGARQLRLARAVEGEAVPAGRSRQPLGGFHSTGGGNSNLRPQLCLVLFGLHLARDAGRHHRSQRLVPRLHSQPVRKGQLLRRPQRDPHPPPQPPERQVDCLRLIRAQHAQLSRLQLRRLEDAQEVRLAREEAGEGRDVHGGAAVGQQLDRSGACELRGRVGESAGGVLMEHVKRDGRQRQLRRPVLGPEGLDRQPHVQPGGGAGQRQEHVGRVVHRLAHHELGGGGPGARRALDAEPVELADEEGLVGLHCAAHPDVGHGGGGGGHHEACARMSCAEPEALWQSHAVLARQSDDNERLPGAPDGELGQRAPRGARVHREHRRRPQHMRARSQLDHVPPASDQRHRRGQPHLSLALHAVGGGPDSAERRRGAARGAVGRGRLQQHLGSPVGRRGAHAHLQPGR
eukprot:scaffold8023_cov103-Isochrysis_galbana.AAC.12